ncbi:hypothetical protein ACJX0J_022175, partial [Zea mays]
LTKEEWLGLCRGGPNIVAVGTSIHKGTPCLLCGRHARKCWLIVGKALEVVKDINGIVDCNMQEFFPSWSQWTGVVALCTKTCWGVFVSKGLFLSVYAKGHGQDLLYTDYAFSKGPQCTIHRGVGQGQGDPSDHIEVFWCATTSINGPSHDSVIHILFSYVIWITGYPRDTIGVHRVYG